jgi:hypothetical protein
VCCESTHRDCVATWEPRGEICGDLALGRGRVVHDRGLGRSNAVPGCYRSSARRSQDGTPPAITTLTLVPAADAQVSQENPDLNYGAKTDLLV